MKILHVIDSSGVWGAEKMLFELVRQQKVLGHIPIIYSIGKINEPKKIVEKSMDALGLGYEAIRIHTLPTPGDLIHIRQRIRVFAPDVIHSHGYKGNVILGLILKKFIKAPIICTLHGWVTAKWEISKLKCYEWLDILAIRNLDAVVTVSEQMLERPAVKRMADAGSSNLHFVNNGISVDFINSSDKLKELIAQISNGRPVIASVGRLSKEKGFKNLIDAFAILAAKEIDCVLLLIGEGAQQEELEEKINRKGLKGKVFIADYIDDVGSQISAADIYACSSLTEGLPITILEAMRGGVPIVSTAVGDLPKLLDNGKAGLLVDVGDAGQFAESLIKILSDSKYSEQLALRAREHFHHYFSSVEMASSYIKIYESVTD